MILLLMGNKYIIGPEWPSSGMVSLRSRDGWKCSLASRLEKSSNTHAQAHAY